MIHNTRLTAVNEYNWGQWVTDKKPVLDANMERVASFVGADVTNMWFVENATAGIVKSKMWLSCDLCIISCIVVGGKHKEPLYNIVKYFNYSCVCSYYSTFHSILHNLLY